MMILTPFKPVHSVSGHPLQSGPHLEVDQDLVDIFARTRSVDACERLARSLFKQGRIWNVIDVLSEGIERHPDSAWLYRLRGHRLISCRQFDRAIADLEKAILLFERSGGDAEHPEAGFDIWYHLALAWFLKGEYEIAVDLYRQCLDYCNDYESTVACTDWLHRSLRRLGRDAEAQSVLEAIDDTQDPGESEPYQRLLMYYRGMLGEHEIRNSTDPSEDDFATVAFGIVNESLAGGRGALGTELIGQILETDQWLSFGFIAAEVEKQRLIH